MFNKGKVGNVEEERLLNGFAPLFPTKWPEPASLPVSALLMRSPEDLSPNHLFFQRDCVVQHG